MDRRHFCGPDRWAFRTIQTEGLNACPRSTAEMIVDYLAAGALGITPRGQDPAKAAPNHSPLFFVDESALVVGTRTEAFLAADFLTSAP